MPDAIRIDTARRCAERVTGLTLPYGIAVTEEKELTVTLEGGRARIGAPDINALTRGFFLLTRALREGRDAFSVTQRRHIPHCGVMLDMSRNAVMKPEAVKRYIDRMACLGMNMLMLYTEDTFEIPEYPAFGYLRGRYTREELKQIDDYAFSMGVELVPCVQTLAHLTQFLQWSDAAQLRDTSDILLIDAPETSRFLEAMIRSVSGCFRSRRIHIGMDEAHQVGLGRYYALHGAEDRFALLTRHLNRVVELCERYGLRPMMWSDMFFRLGSRTGEYYDPEAAFPEETLRGLPRVDMVYWDYYHTEEDFFDRMLSRHEEMGREVVFAGGVWTWSGFLPQVKKTEATMKSALGVCARHGTGKVLATLWGDDGAETNAALADSLLPVFSEACWQGPDRPEEELILTAECLTGLPRRVIDAWGDFYPSEEDQRTGKTVIWCDPLLPLCVLPEGDSLEKMTERSARALAVLEPLEGERIECRYAALLFRVCIEKGRLVSELRGRYLAGDREWLRRAVTEGLPALIALYEELEAVHRALWERDNRRFGWEVLSLRYAGMLGRLKDTAEQLERWLEGDIDAVEELEAVPEGYVRCGGEALYANLCSPCRDFFVMMS